MIGAAEEAVDLDARAIAGGQDRDVPDTTATDPSLARDRDPLVGFKRLDRHPVSLPLDRRCVAAGPERG